MAHKLLETYRYTKGKSKARATYDPHGNSCTRPWKIVVDGEVVIHAESLIQANSWLTHRGYTFTDKAG